MSRKYSVDTVPDKSMKYCHAPILCQIKQNTVECDVKHRISQIQNNTHIKTLNIPNAYNNNTKYNFVVTYSKTKKDMHVSMMITWLVLLS